MDFSDDDDASDDDYDDDNDNVKEVAWALVIETLALMMISVMIIMTTTMQKLMMIMTMAMTMTMSGRLPGPWSPGAKRGLMRWRGTGWQGDHHHHLHLCDHTDNGGYGNGDVIMSYSELIMMI